MSRLKHNTYIPAVLLWKQENNEYKATSALLLSEMIAKLEE